MSTTRNEALYMTQKDRERLRLQRKGATNLWWLSTEVLGFDLLTEDFHKPMMDEMDRERRDYMDRCRRGIPPQHIHDMWARDYYKTTVGQAQSIQDQLVDNGMATAMWWHAVEKKSSEAVEWVGDQWMSNRELRRLGRDFVPPTTRRKFVTSSGFDFDCNNDKDKSMAAAGAGSEQTGGHVRYAYLDDIIGLNDIEDNLMPKKRAWMGGTVRNVIRTDIGWMRGKGTHWDYNDIYHDWRRSKHWNVRVRACYETDGVPDWNGEPVLYSRAIIEAKRDPMVMSKFMFSCQMMNSPQSDELRAWDPAVCERPRISLDQAMMGPGRIFVISDPAPTGEGSLSGVKEKERSDASKDYWAIAVVRLQVWGQKLRVVLLDGSGSQDWSTSAGFIEVCRLMTKWNTNLLFNEYYGGLGTDYTEKVRDIARQVGATVYYEQSPGGGPPRLPRFADSHASGAKNKRMEIMCDMAKEHQFEVCATCPEAFWEGSGDGSHEAALPQARALRFLNKGRNNLRFDDHWDAVSRAADPALRLYTPRPQVVTVGEQRLPAWAGGNRKTVEVSRARHWAV